MGPRPYRGDALIIGAIIAGGRATRFGGDKGAALLDGTALIDHAAAAIRRFVDGIVIVGRDWPGLDRIEDHPAPGLGPLGGIAGALRHAAACRYETVLTIGCDMPRIPPDLIASLLRRPPAVCVDAPVLGAWPVALGLELSAKLAKDTDRSVKAWARSIGALPIEPSRPLANINRPPT